MLDGYGPDDDVSAFAALIDGHVAFFEFIDYVDVGSFVYVDVGCCPG